MISRRCPSRVQGKNVDVSLEYQCGSLIVTSCSDSGSSSQLGKGSLVTLSSGCTDHELLKPGDVGQIIEDDGTATPFKVSSNSAAFAVFRLLT